MTTNVTKIYGVAFAQVYGIFDATTNDPVFDYDTFVSFGVDAKMKVSDFPVENGGFATYNKVTRPYTCKVELAVTNTPARRKAFIVALDQALKGTTKVNIVTQDVTYLNATLESYAFHHDPKSGWGKVVAQLQFIEVREVQQQYANVKVAGGGTSKNGGLVNTIQDPIVANVTGVITDKQEYGVGIAFGNGATLGNVLAGEPNESGLQGLKKLGYTPPNTATSTPATSVNTNATTTYSSLR